MKAIKKATVKTGTYTDKKTGQQKNSYGTIGKLLQREDGSLSLKLDLMPGPDFDGWINFYDLDIAKVREALDQPATQDDFDQDPPF